MKLVGSPTRTTKIRSDADTNAIELSEAPAGISTTRKSTSLSKGSIDLIRLYLEALSIFNISVRPLPPDINLSPRGPLETISERVALFSRKS